MRNLLTLLLLCCSIVAMANDVPALLSELDNVIKERPLYIKKRMEHLGSLNKLLGEAITDEQRYHILGELYSEYNSFNADSSLYIARSIYDVAQRIQNKEYQTNALMNMAEVSGVAGMFKEALDLMKKVDRNGLPAYLVPYYYHIYRTIYGGMADYAVSSSQKEQYNRLTECYRDSILFVNDSESVTYQVVKADKYNVHGQWKEAIKMLENYVNSHKVDIHELAILNYTLADAYRLAGDKINQKRCLLLSSIADMKSGVREYVSLRKLAVLLYQEGDLDRAYSYLKLCMEDAAICNARLRIIETLDIFPVINQAYQSEKAMRQHKLQIMFVCICILSIILLGGIYYLYRQMKRLAMARRQVVDANHNLQQLNEDLCLSNAKLKELNKALSENTYLKEIYIGRYLDQCSTYIEKLNEYRKSLGKMAAAGKIEELYHQLKSSQLVDKELKDFYASFDDTFLLLFPSFVEEFNSLLTANEQIHLKPNERLNTELRIFALIRLGITDSVKIAQFLRYSVTTIYNYRTKARNKAVCNRDDFEKRVMEIGNINGK